MDNGGNTGRQHRGSWWKAPGTKALGAALKARVAEGLGTVVSQADKGAESLVAATRELRSSPALRHGLAARERGNLEAAFWLLAEECDRRPDDAETAAAYWDVAVSLQRIDLAAPVGVRLVEQHAAKGEEELAAQYWVELAGAAPDALVSPTAIAVILPVLRKRLAAAGAERRAELAALARRAMRQAVDPRNREPGPGVALRLFEEGRDINREAARRAAEVALRSPHLHERKRARLEAWLAGDDPVDEPPRRTHPRHGA